MRKEAVILVGLILVGSLTGVFAGTCSESQRIMKLSSESNAHSATYNDLIYTFDICYDEIFGEEYLGETPHPVCNSSNTFLWISTSSNAHASLTQSSDYNVPVCFGNLNCTSRSSCNSGENCVVTLSNDTNAHLASCNSAGTYETKICCISEEPVCIPTTTCETEEYECDSFIDDCGNIVDCGTCTSGNICVSNKCVEETESYWADLSGKQIGEISISNEASVLMILNTSDVSSGDSITFKIYNGSINDANLMKTQSETATEGYAESIWTFSFEDLVGKNSEENGFYFEVSVSGSSIIYESNELRIEILGECWGVNYCSDYSDSALCQEDLCDVADEDVEKNMNLTCGGDYGDYTYECSCVWKDDECRAQENRIDFDIDENPFNSDWQGTCFFDENIATSCSEDEFMSYSWQGIWTWGEASDIRETEYHYLGSEIGAPLPTKYYYDPLNYEEVKESQACLLSSGEKTVPCPSQLKLPFFGFWNIIAGLVLIAGIYILKIKRENNSKILE